MVRGIGIIGLCIMAMDSKRRNALAKKINEATINAGYKLVWFTYFEDASNMQENVAAFGMLDKSFVDGLVVCSGTGYGSVMTDRIIHSAQVAKVPIVTLGENNIDVPFVDEKDSDFAEKLISKLEKQMPEMPRIPLDMLESPEEDADKEVTPEDIGKAEDDIYFSVNKMLDAKEIKDLIPCIREMLPKNAYFCFAGEFLVQYGDTDWDQDKNKVILSNKEPVSVSIAVSKTKVLPEVEKWMYSRDCFILTPSIAKEVVCGYYAFRISSMEKFQLIYRLIVRYINLALNIYIKYVLNRTIMNRMETYSFMDINTGFYNLGGVSKWFREMAAKPENHARSIGFTVFLLPKYNEIYENHGAEAIDEILRIVGSMLQNVYKEKHVIARVQSDEFVVVSSFKADENAAEVIRNNIDSFYNELENFNRRRILKYDILVNRGYTYTESGWEGTLESFIKYANSEMYLYTLNREQEEAPSEDKNVLATYATFDTIIKNNLLTYHLQPIISAKTGDIYGYEALMRTKGSVKMSPLEVIDIATRYDRLGDIEHATLFNVMQLYSERSGEFAGKKIFINTIPGHFLSRDEWSELTEKYGSHFDKFIYEVTEQSSCSEEELESIKKLRDSETNLQIAIDDYGTGHSNIVNLLRYAPQIIKIDRYLITEIQNDRNKQMFVKNAIDFANMNGIKVLAEGVETFEELSAVIEYGVDLIQGYYVSRPQPNVVPVIPEKIRREIVNENLRLSTYNRDLKTYEAACGESLDLINLALNQYTYINLYEGEYTAFGDGDGITDMHIRVADNANVKLTVSNTNIKGSSETPIIVGKNSHLTLVIKDNNTFYKEGVYVPESSSLDLIGDGNLDIELNRNYGCGIGGSFKRKYGNITINMDGMLSMNCSGDRVTAIGGESSEGSIVFEKCSTVIKATGIAIIGIGSAQGESNIIIKETAKIDVVCNGNDAVGIGCFKGKTRVVSSGNIACRTDGERIVSIGSTSGTESRIEFIGGCYSGQIHCDTGLVVGASSGEMEVLIKDTYLDIFAEGARVTCVGSIDGKCDILAESGNINLKTNSGIPTLLGGKNDTCRIVNAVVNLPENA